MKLFFLPIAVCSMILWSGVVQAQGLTIGTVSASDSPDGIVISLSDGLANGSGTGFEYQIYRDTQPIVPIDATPIATVSTLPYVDSSAKPDVLYFYKVVGKDSAGSTVYAPPSGFGNVNVTNSSDLAVAAERTSQIINIVYGGDSITYGANLSDPTHDAPPVAASGYLGAMHGIRSVYFSNQGHGGHSTTDFLPSSGADFAGMESAAKSLEAAHPSGQLVFSLMLGTNDSANSGTHLSNRTPAQVEANFEIIIGQLLADFPSAKIFVNYPPYYTPNTHNGANYEEGGLARLLSYHDAIDKAVATENHKFRGHVMLGDQTASVYFAGVYQTELTPENGQNGTFYLHPNKLGAADLGRLWAEAIYKGLYGSATSSK